MIVGMENDARELVKSVISLAYFMRGAIKYDDLMCMTHGERVLVKEFLDVRLEAEGKKEFQVY